jgi:hypothetical protein
MYFIVEQVYYCETLVNNSTILKPYYQVFFLISHFICNLYQYIQQML